MVQRFFFWISPNQLTLGRIVLIPVLIILMYIDQPVLNLVAVVVFVMAALTDYFDGILARERNEVSQIGKLLDPIADKMLVTACLVVVVSQGHAGAMGAIPTIIILVREFAVSGLRQVASTEGVVIAASGGAKWKTALQMVAIGFLIVHTNPFDLPAGLVGSWLLWLAALWTVVTGANYFRLYYRKASPGTPGGRS